MPGYFINVKEKKLINLQEKVKRARFEIGHIAFFSEEGPNLALRPFDI